MQLFFRPVKDACEAQTRINDVAGLAALLLQAWAEHHENSCTERVWQPLGRVDKHTCGRLMLEVLAVLSACCSVKAIATCMPANPIHMLGGFHSIAGSIALPGLLLLACWGGCQSDPQAFSSHCLACCMCFCGTTCCSMQQPAALTCRAITAVWLLLLQTAFKKKTSHCRQAMQQHAHRCESSTYITAPSKSPDSRI